MISALALYVAASLVVIVHAFRTRLWWGVAVLIVPYAGLLYIFTHLHSRHIAVKLYFASIVILVLGMFLPDTWWIGHKNMSRATFLAFMMLLCAADGHALERVTCQHSELVRPVTNLLSRIQYARPSLPEDSLMFRDELAERMLHLSPIYYCGNDEELMAFHAYVAENRSLATPALVDIAVVTTNRTQQVRAISALAQLSNPSTLPLFRALAASSDVELRGLTPQAFARVYSEDRQVALDVAGLLSDPTESIRYASLFAARDIGDRALLAPVASLFDDPSEKVRVMAYRVWCDIQPSIRLATFRSALRKADNVGRVELLGHAGKTIRGNQGTEDLAALLMQGLKSTHGEVRQEADFQLFLLRDSDLVREMVCDVFYRDRSPVWQSVKTLGFAGWCAEQGRENRITTSRETHLQKALRAYERALENYHAHDNKRKLQINYDEGATLAYRIVRIHQKRGERARAVDACKALGDQFSENTKLYARDFPVPGTNMRRTVKEVTQGLLQDLEGTAQQAPGTVADKPRSSD